MNRHHAWTFAILVLLCAVVAQLPAATITITSTPTLDASNLDTGSIVTTVVLDDRRTGVTQNDADGVKTWTGSLNTSNGDFSWDLFFDPDPAVGGTILITNSTASPQFYSFETGVVSAVDIPVGGIMDGSSSISVADSDNSGTTATMSAVFGDAIYTGKITGVTERTLFPPGASALSAPPNGTNTDMESFASESTSTALPVLGILALRHAFILSAGDTATALSTFVVNVPSPTGSVLLWLGVLGLCFCRRKRTLR